MSLLSYFEKGRYDYVVRELYRWSDNFLKSSLLVQKHLERSGEKSTEVPQRRNPFPLEENKLGHGRPPLSPRHAFSSVPEYLAAIWLGAKIAQETEEKDQESEFTAYLHIVRLEDGSLMCFFNLPSEIKNAIIRNPKARLEEGDHVIVCFDHRKDDDMVDCFDHKKPKDSKVYYDLRIIEPLPFSMPGSLTASMTRRSGTSVVEETKLPDPPVISLGSLSSMSNKEKMKHIMAGAAAEVEARTVWRHSEFVYVFKAAKLLAEKFELSSGTLYDIGQILLNTAAGKHQVERLDMYHTLANKDLASPGRFHLNEGQKKALQMGRAASAGMLICHGGPGTGKTHFVTQLLKPFFVDEVNHRILLTAAGNRGVDNMARVLHEVLQGLGSLARDGVYVMRMHSVKTEIRIFLSDAKAERRRKVAAEKGSKIPTKAGNHTGSTNDAITTHFRAHALGKYEATDDDRLQDIELSVGVRMRKNLSDAPVLLQKLYKKYANGDALDPDEHEELWEMAVDFLRSTIQKCTALCCTVAGAFDHDVHESFSGAEMVIVDEAAKVMEYQLWPLFAFYREAKGKIMVGDPNQLEPSGPRKEDRNPFERQMKLSLQARLQSQNFPTAFFDVQYRVVPEIASIFNNACYSARLQSDITTDVESRPLAQTIRQYNKSHYDVDHSVVFFDVGDAEEDFEGKSKYCEAYITTVSEILEDLLVSGFGQQRHPCTIAILTTYKSEQKRLKYTLTKMLKSELFDENATVVVETVDKAQGMEYDIAIIDPVVVKSAGFLTRNRLNVLFSRARNGLYVVGNKDRWEDMFENKNRGSGELESFATELWRGNTFVVQWPPEWLGDRRARYYDPDEF